MELKTAEALIVKVYISDSTLTSVFGRSPKVADRVKLSVSEAVNW